ncbi:BLOC-1-related complex subunit 6 [Trichosurus vulpecula]|uniref:BLOC-1-related complex subunit 6 n=1 Tax=Trichosurus vulpecula TaxID=9337 RepID=UPI00186AC4B9|nr:BLOC-1-related complex subunit 6 [Trichosurus vulpecula]
MEPAPGRPGLESRAPLSGCSRNSSLTPRPGKQPSLPPPSLGSGEIPEEEPGVGGCTRLGGTRKTPSLSAYETPGACGTPPGAGVGRGPGGPTPTSPRPLGRPVSVPQGTKQKPGGSVPRGAPRNRGMNPEEEEEEEEEREPEKGGRPFAGRLQDSRSLDGLSGACGGGAAPLGGPEQGAGGGRRATISSALELEGTVSRHGDLTHFVANNLQLKIRLSGNPQPQPPPSARPAPVPAPSIPPIDPEVLRDLERLSRELGARVERLLRGLGGAVQELTALSVGCIQTYRDAVDSLGEAVDMSIKGMYTLLARCEELERALQPVQGLARQVRDIRRTLEVLEALCK